MGVAAQCPEDGTLDLCPVNNSAPPQETNSGGRGRAAAWVGLLLPLVSVRPSLATGLILSMAVAGADAADMSCGHVKSFYQAQDCCGQPEQALDFSGSEGSSFSESVCGANSPAGVCNCAKAMELLAQVPNVQFPADMCSHLAHVKPVGFHDQPICEASDAGANSEYLVDGRAGNTNFPHGNIKVLATVGEVDPDTGSMLTGQGAGSEGALRQASVMSMCFCFSPGLLLCFMSCLSCCVSCGSLLTQARLLSCVQRCFLVAQCQSLIYSFWPQHGARRPGRPRRVPEGREHRAADLPERGIRPAGHLQP